MKIFAIDLGQFNSVALIKDTNADHQRFQKFDTQPHVLHDLLVEHAPDMVLIEVCPLAGWVSV